MYFPALIFLSTVILTQCSNHEAASTMHEDSPQKQDRIEFPLSQTTISRATVSKLSKLDMEDLIKILRRDYHVRVLILDYTPLGRHIFVPHLVRLNLEEEDAARAIYTKMAHDRKDESSASFLEAGIFGKRFRDFTDDRPLIDHDLILVHRDAERHMLLHEIFHLLVSRSPEYQQRRKERGVRSLRKSLADDVDKTSAIHKKNVEAYNKMDLRSPLPEISNALFEGAVAYAQAVLDVSDATLGEEMDIARFMMENVDLLFKEGSMPRDEYTEILCKSYYKDNLVMWLSNYTAAEKIIQEVVPAYRPLKNRGILKDGVVMKFEAFIASYNKDRLNKVKESLAWLENHVKQ